MARAKDEGTDEKQPPASNKEKRKAIGNKLDSEDSKRVLELINQALPTAQRFVDENGDEISRVSGILKTIAGLEPRDEAERMLVAQMIATHESAMESFRRAMLPDQTYAGRDMNLKHAAKLTSMYAKQVEALDKHRGKGKQKITVEHVNVHAGGQAIVGDVNASESSKASRKRAPEQLTDNSAQAFDGEELKRATEPKRNRKQTKDRS